MIKPNLQTARPGFSLVELVIALTITAVIGVAMTGLFMTQARFLEVQQKNEFARGVTRSATNILMSELRMLDRDSGVAAATDTSLVVRVPFAMGITCASTAASLTMSLLPVDSLMYSAGVAAMIAGNGGFAYRKADGTYNYVTYTGTVAPPTGVNGLCNTTPSPGIAVLTSDGGLVKVLATAALMPATVGQPVLLYQTVRYHFNTSTTVSGRRGLYRTANGVDEELVAPFDTSARFSYYVNDSKTPTTTVPGTLSSITGIDLVLNTVNEKPNPNGTYTVVPARTAVFFKNRRN